MNDGTAGEDYSLQYIKLDDIVAGVMHFGRGTLMAKSDAQNVYRIVPVHPEDRPLLGMKWQGALYVDMVLPFGIRSAPASSLILQTLLNGLPSRITMLLF